MNGKVFLVAVVIGSLLAIGTIKYSFGGMMGELPKAQYAISRSDVPTFSIYSERGMLLYNGAYDVTYGYKMVAPMLRVKGLYFMLNGERKFVAGDRFWVEPEPPHGLVRGPRK